MDIVRYRDYLKGEWDEFVRNSKTPHFMFYRDYMEYHRDRFDDCSLMVRDDSGGLVAVFPANASYHSLISHQGLTFGGLIFSKETKTPEAVKSLSEVLKFVESEGFKELVYKKIPYIYHISPSDEDLYALYIEGADLIRRDVSTSIFLKNKIKYSSQRKRSIKKSNKNGVIVDEAFDSGTFWDVVTGVLCEAHGVAPVHSSEEMQYLKNKFPDNIKFYCGFLGDDVVSAVVVYNTCGVVHTQYLAATDAGKDVGALDAIIDFLISTYETDDIIFDFGISTENDGLYLNQGLIRQKEGFGGRSIVHDSYRISV